MRRTLSTLLLLMSTVPGAGCTSTWDCKEEPQTQTFAVDSLVLLDGGRPTADTPCEDLCASVGGGSAPCERLSSDGGPPAELVKCEVRVLCE